MTIVNEPRVGENFIDKDNNKYVFLYSGYKDHVSLYKTNNNSLMCCGEWSTVSECLSNQFEETSNLKFTKGGQIVFVYDTFITQGDVVCWHDTEYVCAMLHSTAWFVNKNGTVLCQPLVGRHGKVSLIELQKQVPEVKLLHKKWER